jgi:hypothetical protein
MSAREDEIRRVVAELDVHVAEVEAGLAALKALLAEVDVPDSAHDLPDLACRRGHPGDEASGAHVPAASPRGSDGQLRPVGCARAHVP